MVQRIAMGTCCAPAYVNLYLGVWEQTVFSAESLCRYTNHALCWMRYIDYIFIVYFIVFIVQTGFKFTVSSDQHQITILDLKIFIDVDNCLATNLFQKKTAVNTLLHTASAHPPALICSIPFMQYIRLRHNCTHTKHYSFAHVYQ